MHAVLSISRMLNFGSSGSAVLPRNRRIMMRSFDMTRRDTTMTPWCHHHGSSQQLFRPLSTTSTTLYLHVGPSGDAWTGDSIFAAKHLQPDYVKSVPLPKAIVNDEEAIENLLILLEENEQWSRQIYDTQELPLELLKQVIREGSTTIV